MTNEKIVTENDLNRHTMTCEKIQTAAMVVAAISAVGMVLLVLLKK